MLWRSALGADSASAPNMGAILEWRCKSSRERLGRRLFGDVAEMLGGSSPIYLLEKPAGSVANRGSAQRRDYGRHWTPAHLDVVVTDIQAAAASPRKKCSRA